ncbi:hypothetical protein ES703_54111 [subsurface metagenome]
MDIYERAAQIIDDAAIQKERTSVCVVLEEGISSAVKEGFSELALRHTILYIVNDTVEELDRMFPGFKEGDSSAKRDSPGEGSSNSQRGRSQRSSSD